MNDAARLGIGKIITTEQAKDAIHFAIAPVTAGESIKPGKHIRIENGVAFMGGNVIGIADPFLLTPIKKGDRFWLFLYPQTVTSMRHEWTHPEFTTDAPVIDKRSASEVWMRAWAMKHMSADYYGDRETLSEDEAYRQAIEAGESNHVGPYESARDYIDSEWWSHWEAITGKKGRRGEYFNCGC